MPPLPTPLTLPPPPWPPSLPPPPPVIVGTDAFATTAAAATTDIVDATNADRSDAILIARHAIVATKAATQVFSHLAKILVYGAPLIAAGAKGLPPWPVFAAAIPLSMLGTVVGGRILDRMSDVNFKAWTRWIVTAVGVTYLFQAAQLFLKGQGA